MGNALEPTVVNIESRPQPDLREVLVRRRWPVILTFVIAVLLGVGSCFLIRPEYQRTVRILVEGKNHPLGPAASNDPLNSALTPAYVHDVDTQMEILKSDAIQVAACQAAGIAPDRLLDPLHPALHVDVKQVNQTDVIEVTINGTDRRQVARLAETIARVYVTYVSENHRVETTRALNFALVHKEQEKSKLREAETALEAFKRRAQLTNLDTERNNQIIEAINSDERVRRAEETAASAQARFNTAVVTRKALPANVATKTSTSNTQRIQAYQDRIAALQAEKTSISYYYKPGSPELARIDRQVVELTDQLSKLPPTVTTYSSAPNAAVAAYDDKVAEARGALTAANAELATARISVASLAGQLQRYGPLERRQAELVRDVEEHRNAFNMLSNGVAALSLRETGTRIPVDVLSTSQKARQIEPRPLLYVGLSALMGLVLGCLCALAMESLDSRLNTVGSYLKATGGAALAYVPLMKKQGSQVFARDCDGALVESYLRMRSNILFAATGEWINTLAVVSTLPGEGKSHTAMNLAATMVVDGRRVILVDADIHWPTLHEKLGLRRGLGLTDVLKGEVSLERALQDTSVPGLRFLSAGSLTATAGELFDTRAMRTLNATLKQTADMVIYDTPACLACVDASVITSFADGVVYVAELGRVKREAFSDSLDILWQANANIIGFVFNKVDPRSSQGLNHFGHQRYYTRRPLIQLEQKDPARDGAVAWSPPIAPTDAKEGAF